MIRKIAIASLLLIGAPVFAASLSVERGIELMAVDGKAYDGNALKGSHLELSEAQHQFVFRYSANLRDGSSRTLLESTPQVFEFDFVKADNVSLISPKFSVISQGKAYFRRDEPWKALVDGKEVTLETEKLPGQGFMPYANIEKPLAAYNLGKKNQWAPEGVTKLVQTQLVDQGNNGETFATFKLLYQNATDEQKAQIKQWINAQ